ncbi:MAG: hexose kinase [Clostridia bacterium]|nr:hexose kinase [Clostridia bacterium]
MILTVCPNPSIDCTIELDNLNVGMLNRIRNKIETYSGKALNVAMGIARLQGNAMATGFMFQESRSMFEQTLKREGVAFKFINNEGSARTNYKIIDNKSMLTEINDKGQSVSRNKQIELINLVKKLAPRSSVTVMSGSLPQGVDASFYHEVLSVIPKSVKKIVDAEHQNIDEALKGEVFMIKPNLRELEGFTGRTLRTKGDIIASANLFIERGVKVVLVSLGADGAIITNGTENYFCKSATVAINSTVGAGDCMLSSVCVELEKGNEDLKELLRVSVASGTAAITTRGTNLFYKDKFEEIFEKLVVEKI